MAEPTIVSSWAEMATAISNGATNIKYSDTGTKHIDLVDITNRIDGRSKLYIDFNGWTIDIIKIVNFTDTYGSSSNYTLFNQQSVVSNLTVNHIYVYNTAPVYIYLFYQVYSSYFNDIWFQSRRNMYTDFNVYGGFKLFYQCFDCKLSLRGTNYTPRIPLYITQNADPWYNCELKINYKWNLSVPPSSAACLFGYGVPAASIGGNYSIANLVNCYLYGTIELGGNGTWQGTKYYNKYGVGYIRATKSIINIQFVFGESTVLKNLGLFAPHPDISEVSDWEDIPDKSLIVTNNTNNTSKLEAALNIINPITIDNVIANFVSTTLINLKSADWLSDIAFDYIDDDDYRYAQYHGITSPIQGWTWRKSEYINQQVPFLPFYNYPVYVPPVIYPIERADRISVYDIYEPQSGYDHNGVAILFPSEVISYKEDMGRWDINLTHPIDQYGKWTYIIGQNCIKVNGQIFRIDETEIYCDANQQYIKAHANHITYDLNDAFIGDATFEVTTGNSFEYEIIQASKTLIPTQEPTPYEYTFELTSDITGQLVGDFHDQTVTGALYGDDNSFANRYGGHLYRDNFHISINTVQENLPAAPAFQIRYGTDMTKISYKIDFSSWITELICEDNFGNLWGIAYTGSEWIIHHNKTKRIHFTYPPETPDPMACLEADGFNYWQTVNTPKVSIEVSVANIKSDPKYKDFLNLQNMDVGYTGTVYFEQMGIDVDLKIVSIKRNELTGEAIQITLGNAPNSFIRSPVCSQTIVPNGSVEAKQAQTIKDMQTEIENVKLKSMKYWNGMKNYTWADVKKYKWEEIKNGELNN